jgi:hypothetical protein
MSARKENTAESVRDYLIRTYDSKPIDWGINTVLGFEERRGMLSGGVNVRLIGHSLSQPSVGLRSLVFNDTIEYERAFIPTKRAVVEQIEEGEGIPKLPEFVDERITEESELVDLPSSTGDTSYSEAIEQTEQGEVQFEMGELDMPLRRTPNLRKERRMSIDVVSKVSFRDPIDSCGSTVGQKRKTKLEALRLHYLSRQPDCPVAEVLYIHPNNPTARYTDPQTIFMLHYPGRTPFSEFMQLERRQLKLINALGESDRPISLKEIARSMTSSRFRVSMSDIRYLVGLELLKYSAEHQGDSEEAIELSDNAKNRFIFHNGMAYDRTFFKTRRRDITRMCLETLVQFHKTAETLKTREALKPEQLNEEQVFQIISGKVKEIVKYLGHNPSAIDPRTLKTIRDELIHPLYRGRKTRVVVGDANNSNLIAVTNPYQALKEVRVLDVFHCRLDDTLSDFIDFLQAQRILSGMKQGEYRSHIEYALSLDPDFKGHAERQSFLRQSLPIRELYRALYVLGAIAGESNHLYENPRHHFIPLSEKQASLHERFVRYFYAVDELIKGNRYSNRLRNAVHTITHPRR